MNILESKRLEKLVLIGLLLLALASNPAVALAKHGGPPPHGGGGGLTGTLVVEVTFVTDDRLHLHAKVTRDDMGVKGAEVVLTITVVPLADPNDSREIQLKSKTEPDGVAHFVKKRNRPPRPGTYTVDATATKDLAGGECTGCLVFDVG